MGGANTVDFAAARISDLNFLRGHGIALVFNSNRRAIEPDPHRRRSAVEFAVIRTSGDDISSGIARYGAGYEPAYQQAGNRCVAVGKVEEVLFGFLVGNGVTIHAGARRGIEVHAAEPWIVQSPRVLGGDGVNTHPEQRVWTRLQNPNNLFVHTDHIAQELRITHARELCLLGI